MKFSIWFSGPAGSGVNTCGLIIGQILSEYGYFVYGDKEYSSLIKGGNNLFTLFVSDTHHFISSKIDEYIHFDDFAVEKNSEMYTFGSKHFVDKKTWKEQNAFAIWLASKILSIPLEKVEASFLSKIKDPTRKEANLSALLAGFSSEISEKIKVSAIGTPKEFLFGNEMIGNGAIASGLEFYSAYPMTPASSLIDVIAPNENVIFSQWEDEIAVAMSMLGAKFAGKRAMCGTSGGGFALMSESMSFSHQAELGGVYILSQRAGPSTGTPTFTGQWDLNYALNATFWDVFPIVIAPYTFENGYNLIGKALNWSDVYQYPVIFLVDKSFSESYLSVDSQSLKNEPIFKGKLAQNPEEGFARYAFSRDGISEYSIPGAKNWEYIATSYEHDIYGKETENSALRMKMEEKRFAKLETFKKEVFTDEFFGFDIVNPDAEIFYITYGINYFAIAGHLANLPEDERKKYGIITFTVLAPIDMRFRSFLESRKDSISKLIFVEQNYSGQLEKHIVSEGELYSIFWKEKISHIRSYNLYPFFEESLWETV